MAREIERIGQSSVNLGADAHKDGVTFALFSENATGVELCVFDDSGQTEVSRHRLHPMEGGIWAGMLPGIGVGTRYGYRVDGPYAPEQGHRFNRNKLLLDPYATESSGELKWDPAVFGYKIGEDDLTFDERDSAPFVPKAVVRDPIFDWDEDRALRHPWSTSFIYEAHVRGLTMLNPHVEERLRGTFTGVASDAIIDHLLKLGVTAIELLPIHYFLTDQHLFDKGLKNYWGYQTLGFFAPHPDYLGKNKISEFKSMVRKFHSAGIEVIMDVVFNHTAEGNEKGPTLSFKGIDNASYYKLVQDNKRHFFDETGTGNTLQISHPMVLRMVLDSLRYWVEAMHVDGFRFDLASTLGREPWGFDREGSFFDAIRQDPILRHVKLIAEPWDVGAGGYQVGGFPAPFREWNDKFRDRVRGYWRGGEGMRQGLVESLLGSPVQFQHSRRAATTSINFLAAHDGFTLHDTVSYDDKHNEANGENSRDGHDNNVSDNMGAEGPTDDEAINAVRGLRKRNMLATLFLSRGVPMILAGDELGKTQDGNNNVYCQDNELSWIDWKVADHDLAKFVGHLAGIRKRLSALRGDDFLVADANNNAATIIWLLPDGKPMREVDWQDAGLMALAFLVRAGEGHDHGDVYVAINNSNAVTYHLPDHGPWALVECTALTPLAINDNAFELASAVAIFERSNQKT